MRFFLLETKKFVGVAVRFLSESLWFKGAPDANPGPQFSGCIYTN